MNEQQTKRASKWAGLAVAALFAAGLSAAPALAQRGGGGGHAGGGGYSHGSSGYTGGGHGYARGGWSGRGGGWGNRGGRGYGWGGGWYGGAYLGGLGPWYGGWGYPYDYGYGEDYYPYSTAAPSQWWCSNPQGYYPQVPNCSAPWQAVPPG